MKESESERAWNSEEKGKQVRKGQTTGRKGSGLTKIIDLRRESVGVGSRPAQLYGRNNSVICNRSSQLGATLPQ